MERKSFHPLLGRTVVVWGRKGFFIRQKQIRGDEYERKIASGRNGRPWWPEDDVWGTNAG
ncbi:hypothetical protein GCM10010965_00740 [Caldalkalibacillus thermarum]|nr:hypothetical protein GCM10010965_00740 [Caldalkalibacillus thermarum]